VNADAQWFSQINPSSCEERPTVYMPFLDDSKYVKYRVGQYSTLQCFDILDLHVSILRRAGNANTDSDSHFQPMGGEEYALIYDPTITFV